MATLPRGIQEQSYPLADGSTVKKFRVRIVRKDFKADRLFDDLIEAKEFLLLSKANRGREIIFSITEKEELERREQEKIKAEKTKIQVGQARHTFLQSQEFFGYYIKKYIETYIDTKPQETELQKRNVANIKSFFRTILTTEINISGFSDVHIQKMQEFKEDYKPDEWAQLFNEFGYMKIADINVRTINSYIRSRLRFVKPISVAREITQISNVYRKLVYLTDDYHKYPNVALLYDKDLLKYRTTKKELDISESEIEKFFKLLKGRQSQAMYNICRLSYLTAMRRSEVIYLTKSAIKDNYIFLGVTKSGSQRKVYFSSTEERDFAHSLQPLPNTDRLFSYTTSGFDRVFKAFVDRIKSKIRFHDFRRLAISNTLNKFGHDNSVLVTTRLGISSVSKFEELYIDKQKAPTDQRSAMMSFGHSLPQTTKVYFNIPKLEEKKK